LSATRITSQRAGGGRALKSRHGERKIKVTGVANFNVELGPKKLELLHELVPAATVIGLLVNPAK
jgi:putative ABC transport system substrate-binding protein